MQQFYPYKELKCTIQGDELRLETPWTEIHVECEKDRNSIEKALAQINAKNYSDPGVSEFFENFRHNFISHSVPRSDLRLNIDHCTRLPKKVSSLIEKSATAWADAYLPGVAHQLDLKNYSWKWNVTEVLNSSRVPSSEIFDAESAYRQIMRMVLNEMSTETRGPKLFVDHLRKLAKADETKFFQAARIFIRQYHHITSTSSDCLMPAMYNMPYAADLVQELAQEELGHGQFTLSSYKALGGKHPYETALDPYTVGLMDLLKQAASTNAFAFSVLFTIFEVSGEQEDDPLATLLKNSSAPKAGDGLQKHFQLNKDGAHFQSGFPLIERLSGIDEASVVEATRFAELLMAFFHMSAMSMIRDTSH
jgi:hypothetical protein